MAAPLLTPRQGPRKMQRRGWGSRPLGGPKLTGEVGKGEVSGKGQVSTVTGAPGAASLRAHTHLGREIGSQTHTHTHITLTLYHLFSRPPLPKHRDLWPSLATGAPLCMPPADPQPPSLRPCAHAQIRGRLDFSYHH